MGETKKDRTETCAHPSAKQMVLREKEETVWEEGLGCGLSCPLSLTPQGRGSQG